MKVSLLSKTESHELGFSKTTRRSALRSRLACAAPDLPRGHPLVPQPQRVKAVDLGTRALVGQHTRGLRPALFAAIERSRRGRVEQRILGRAPHKRYCHSRGDRPAIELQRPRRPRAYRARRGR